VGQVIADIGKNSREIIRVEVSEFKGKDLINLRIWFQHFDGEYKPTQKGITLDVAHYKELKDAIDKVGQYLMDKKKGVVPDINQKIADTIIEDENEETEKTDS
jgi:hypothetical protein